MDGSYPVRITREGDHQVVHLPPHVAMPEAAVVRQEGDRLIIEAVTGRTGSSDLLARWADEGPLAEEDRMPPIPRAPARPFNL